MSRRPEPGKGGGLELVLPDRSWTFPARSGGARRDRQSQRQIRRFFHERSVGFPSDLFIAVAREDQAA